MKGKKIASSAKLTTRVDIQINKTHKCLMFSISALPHFFNYFLLVREETHDKKCVG